MYFSERIYRKWIRHYQKELLNEKNIKEFSENEDLFCYKNTKKIPESDLRVLMFGNKPEYVTESFPDDDPELDNLHPTREFYALKVYTQILHDTMTGDDGKDVKAPQPYSFYASKLASNMVVLDADKNICAIFHKADGYYIYETPHGFAASDGEIAPSLKAFIDSLKIEDNEKKIELIDAWEEVQTVTQHDRMNILD